MDIKYLLLLICLLYSFESRSDIPSLVLCLGEFKTIEGKAKSYYFNISSDVLYADGELEVKNKIIDLSKETEIFTRFYDVNCGRIHSFGIDKRDLVNSSTLNLKNVRIRYVVFQTKFGYLGFPEENVLNDLKSDECRCINFDIDTLYQDKGGDGWLMYYMFSKKEKSYLKNILKKIKTSYTKYSLKYDENNYSGNDKLFQQFIKNEIEDISYKDVSTMY